MLLNELFIPSAFTDSHRVSSGLRPCPSFCFAQHPQVITCCLWTSSGDLVPNNAIARAGGLSKTGLQNPTHQEAASGPLPGVCTSLQLLEALSTMDLGSWVVKGARFCLVLLGGPSQTLPSVLPEARATRLCSGGRNPRKPAFKLTYPQAQTWK